MKSAEIRSRFLTFFEQRGHAVRPSSSLVPADDPTLLFTNAGMVQFKRVFLGGEEPPAGKRRATTAQKCVRAGGKHNDLEQVGFTARHHTFFEMLGNFSFGDYFKREAIQFAWDLVTKEFKIPAEHLRVTVFHSDDEARALWREIANIPDNRIYGLGEKDNFWQMADTGPCGPCTEIYVDLAHLAKDWTPPAGEQSAWTNPQHIDLSEAEFVEAAEAGRFVEIWNLVFMQYDRQPDGTLLPLPKPSVDTGAGLERLAAVLQGVSNNFDTDLFAPLLEAVRAQLSPEQRDTTSSEQLAALRVIADHARSVAFLLADGVFPSNEGRGYVLRRILRRAVRYAWLLGRREPTLERVVAVVIDTMKDVYPELEQRRTHILNTTRAEEERFLATIEGGMRRFDELAPEHTTQERTIAGEDAFKLYDTYGFPIDLTELMARERGYTVDIAGFERALEVQRTQSQEERKAKKVSMSIDDLGDINTWSIVDGVTTDELQFVGYEHRSVVTEVVGIRELEGGRVAVMLRESPFYAESGGQVSDIGEIVGDSWRVDVDDVRKVGGKPVALGKSSGQVSMGKAVARVPEDRRRDTERNHTATHLLHAALRHVLGDHVRQAGSLVAWDRLRFDFTHNGPMTAAQIREVEDMVNRGVLAAVPVITQERSYADAIASGAMALFGEKYGDIVRVVDIPAFSTELCGGTHVRNTAEIGYFKIVSESGIAAGVRRIEAISGSKAIEFIRDQEDTLKTVAELVKATPTTLVKRVQTLADERRTLEKRLADMMKGGGAGSPVQALLSSAQEVAGLRVVAQQQSAPDVKTLQSIAEAVRDQGKDAIVVLVASFEENKNSVVVAVGDAARDRGARADTIVKALAERVGGRGGGKPQLAQAGIPDPSGIATVLAAVPEVVTAQLA
jgi:alanyl-tRNA synthetase